jgi:hypothetical protein
MIAVLSTLHSGDGKEVVSPMLCTFMISVIAGVVSYYVCKWLDGDDSDN